MTHVAIKDAEKRLYELTQEARDGERIVLTKDGEEIAELRGPPPRQGGINVEALRKWNQERGITHIVEYIPDDFDDALPEDFLITPDR